MIYLDNNATTQPTSQVVEAMLPYLTKCYFNPSASTAAHTGADRPRRLAAAAMVKLLNAEESECFVFTSGATESNNWVFSSLISHNPTGRVVVSAIEHPSVSEPAAEFARRGGDVVTVPVDDQGVVKLDHLRAALSDVTVLVSIMAASNESGVLQPIEAIGSLIRELCPSAIFHVDGTQAVGKIPIDLQAEWSTWFHFPLINSMGRRELGVFTFVLVFRWPQCCWAAVRSKDSGLALRILQHWLV